MTEDFNHYQIAVEAVRDWLLTQWENADLVDILDNDPDGVQLLDGDYEKTIEFMSKLKVDIRVQ